MRAPAALAAIAALTAALVLSGCGEDAEARSIVDKKILVIGVKDDQPGLGLEQSDGTFEGFDVDVAKYVAAKLGATPRFRAVVSAKREQFLEQSTVDLVVATYSITEQRKKRVTFGGPYYVAHQDTLIRADDPDIDDVRDLEGKRLCQVSGSVSWHRVTEERTVAADLVPAAAYGECVSMLARGRVDAVSTDNLILAGFAASARGQFKIINAPISDEKYGIGIPLGDLDGCEAINTAITEMYQDGTAAALLKRWFGSTSLKPTTTVPQFEGCG